MIPLVKDPPSNAGDADSIPDRGNNIPCAAEQLSPPATTGEAHVLQQRPGTAKKKKKIKKKHQQEMRRWAGEGKGWGEGWGERCPWFYPSLLLHHHSKNGCGPLCLHHLLGSPTLQFQLSLDPKTFIFLHCPFRSRLGNKFLLLEISESLAIPFWFFLSGSHLCK